MLLGIPGGVGQNAVIFFVEARFGWETGPQQARADLPARGTGRWCSRTGRDAVAAGWGEARGRSLRDRIEGIPGCAGTYRSQTRNGHGLGGYPAAGRMPWLPGSYGQCGLREGLCP